jgi:cobalt-zinc-cadmium efflux system outer membrane protein
LEHVLKIPIILSLILAATVGHGQKLLGERDALGLAAKNRPALTSAKLLVAQAEVSAMAQSAAEPLTFLLGGSTRSELGSTDQDLQLSQPIDLFGRRAAKRAAGSAGVRFALAEYRDLALTVQHEVLEAFSKSVAARQKKDVADGLLKIAEGLFSATKRRFDEGKVAETQLTRASIEVERAKQFADAAEAERRATLTMLGGALGIDEKEIEVPTDSVFVRAQDSSVDGRPEVMLAAAEVEVAEAEAGLAKVSNRPELNVQLLRSPWNAERGYFAGRIQLTWAISDNGRAKNERVAARLRAESARKRLEDATARAKAEARAAELLLAAQERRVQSYQAILTSARDLAEKSQRGYSEGFGTQMEVLDASRALREAEQELVEARLELAQTVIAQYQAYGVLKEELK